MPQIHHFYSTGEAYDASQTDDNIKDGDLLIVPREEVVGFLLEAWPTAVTEKPGEFHHYPRYADAEAVDKIKAKYTETLVMCKNAIEMLRYDLGTNWE